MSTYLITGANRGIGLAYVKQLVQDPSNNIIATARNDSAAKVLTDLNKSNLKVILIDVLSPYSDFEKAFKKLDDYAPEGVDVVIHNAGIGGPNMFASSIDYDLEAGDEVFSANYTGTTKVYKAIYPYVFKGQGTKKIVFTSSTGGSTGDMIVGANAYGASKAAVNHFGVQVARENAASENPIIKGSVTILLHPGVVDTDMAQAAKALFPPEMFITPETSAAGTLKLVAGLTAEDSGKFLDYDGNDLKF